MKIKNRISVIVIILVVVLSTTKIFAINTATIGLDKGLLSSYLAEDESGNDEIKKVIRDFKANYATDAMTDFEIEMQIIKYLVATVTYDEEELDNTTPDIGDTFKAYGALINHKAVCSGYAKAFDLLAKSCGLSSIVVTGEGYNSTQNGPHAWNQIYLDNEWYNVDVTWEDPKTNVELGFNNLINEYINGTDADFSKDHRRDNGNVCTATKYGPKTVSYYLMTGIVNTNPNLDSLRKDMINQIKVLYLSGKNDEAKVVIDKLTMLGAKFDDNSNFFPDNNDVKITNYVKSELAKGETIIVVVSGINSHKNLSLDSGHWLDDNIEGNATMQVHFASDGEKDTRILIFSK